MHHFSCFTGTEILIRKAFELSFLQWVSKEDKGHPLEKAIIHQKDQNTLEEVLLVNVLTLWYEEKYKVHGRIWEDGPQSVLLVQFQI